MTTYDFLLNIFKELNFQIHRLRFWLRQKENPCELKLLDTVELREDEYEVAGYTMERVNEVGNFKRKNEY